MENNNKLLLVLFLMLTGALAVGCKPKTVSEKVKDKVEDAGHEMGQGIERAGERVRNASN